MPAFEIALHQQHPIHAQAVCALYDSAGWWPERQEQEITQVLDSGPAVGAWDGELLVGFARAVSDHHFRAYIEDMIVHSDYQHMGVGNLLLGRLMEALEHVNTVSLFCEPGLIPFYEHYGFRAISSQKVMHRTKTLF